MNLSGATILTLFRAEMRMVLRDRRMVLTAVVLPILVTPIVLFGSTWTSQKRERTLEAKVYQYAVTGSQSNLVRALVAKLHDPPAPAAASDAKASLRLKEVDVANARTNLHTGELQFVLEGMSAEEYRAESAAEERRQKESAANRNLGAGRSRQATSDGEARTRRTPLTGAPVVRVVFRGDRDDSATAVSRIQEALSAVRHAERTALLQARGFPFPPDQVASVVEVNVASTGQVAGLALGRIITPLLLFFLFTAGAVVATDLLAGEKERGTLETLLTTAVGRVEIVAAKHLVIVAVALFITLVQSANLLVYVGLRLIPLPADFATAVPPGVAVLLFVLFLPMTALVSSALLLTSGYAKSYKEAQLYFLPVLLLSLLPASVAFFPSLPLRSVVLLVPIANLSLAAKDILVGSFDWPAIVLSWGVTGVAAVWLTRLSVRVLSAERLISSVDRDVVEFIGGPALFDRHVGRWFLVLWAVLLLISNYEGALDLRVQLLLNLGAVFGGGSLLMVWRYRLDPRQALALRLPRPAVWLALPLAVPGGLLSGTGLFHLANRFIPVPPQMIEGFTESVIPDGIPFFQLLLFLTVMPGIVEEITFRGLLLHGLHRRLHPVVVALVVGLTFGVFHLALFRILPTAFLGVLFAAVTLMTGSIFPAMVWHALSNGLGVLAAKGQIPLSDLDPAVSALGLPALAGAFWIFWRHRTPYPGLRTRAGDHHRSEPACLSAIRR